MPLQPGTRLGPYEITAEIGVDGMGEADIRVRVSATNLAVPGVWPRLRAVVVTFGPGFGSTRQRFLSALQGARKGRLR